MLESLVASVASLRKDHQHIHEKVGALALGLESLQKTIAADRQLIVEILDQVARMSSVQTNGGASTNGFTLLRSMENGANASARSEPGTGLAPLDRLKEIDHDILRVASATCPYMGKQLASRTQKYKFNPYFRSRLSYLYKHHYLDRCGEGYLLASRMADRSQREPDRQQT